MFLSALFNVFLLLNIFSTSEAKSFERDFYSGKPIIKFCFNSFDISSLNSEISDHGFEKSEYMCRIFDRKRIETLKETEERWMLLSVGLVNKTYSGTFQNKKKLNFIFSEWIN